MRRTPFKIAGCSLLLLCIVGAIVFLALRSPGPGKPWASVLLPDGRILQIEALTYGTEHRVGSRSLLVEHFGPWLPAKLNEFATPKYPRSKIQRDQPGLVVWVNALDPLTGKQVDCQSIRVEFIDEHGDLFGEETRYWFGGNSFWRVGHLFDAFPRTEQPLTLQITPWRSNQTVQVKFPNPFVATRARWSGQPLPQQQRAGDLDILLTGLAAHTNGGPKNYWETPSRYWEPIWELRQRGVPATGWDAPEWSAEDGSGNHGKFLGLHEPVLRFSAKCYPWATNTSATVLVTNSPFTTVTNLASNIWWNISARFASNDIIVLGLFPSGTHVFSEGVYQTNPPAGMGPPQGGAPSGWVGQGKRISPTRTQYWKGHYTPSPVIYLRAAPLPADQRLAVRLRDEHGRYWIAKPEPGGASQAIRPFLVELPPDVTAITAEVVLLKPVQATFDVETAGAAGRGPK